MFVFLFTMEALAAFESLKSQYVDITVDQYIIKDNFWGFSYTNRFNLPEMGIFVTDFYFQKERSAVYTKISYTGDEVYNEHSYLISYKQSMKQFSILLIPMLNHAAMKGYSSYSNLGCTVALSTEASAMLDVTIGRDDITIYENRKIGTKKQDDDFLTLILKQRHSRNYIEFHLTDFRLVRFQLMSVHNIKENIQLYFKAVDKPQSFHVGFVLGGNLLRVQSRLMWNPPLGMQQQGKLHFLW